MLKFASSLTVFHLLQLILSEIVPIRQGMVVVDVGHGIGTLPLQAAHTTGCEARGIEVDSNRHLIADQLQKLMGEEHRHISALQDKVRTFGMYMYNNFAFQYLISICVRRSTQERTIGDVRLIRGRLQDPALRSFLTEGVDLMICNNYNGVFRERSQLKRKEFELTLDDYTVGNFLWMKPHSVLLTLEKMPMGPGLEEANKRRTRQGLRPSETATFFTEKVIEFDDTDENRDMLTFRVCSKDFSIYLYTRTQSTVPTFLCNNAKCSHAINNVPIDARKELDTGRTVLNRCPICNTAITTQSARSRKAVKRFVATS